MELLPYYAPLIPLLAASILSPFTKALREYKRILNLSLVITVASHIISLLLVIMPHGLLWISRRPVLVTSFLRTTFLSSLYVDYISVFFICLALGLGILVALYSMHILKEDDAPELYYSLLNLVMASLFLLFTVGDLISLFASWELMSITLYALIFLRRSEPLSLEAGTKYLIMSATSSAFIIYAISLTYGSTGHLDFIGVQRALSYEGDLSMVYLAVIFFTVAFGFKAAVVPFHTWAPDVYQETIDPITAFLSGIASKAGIYALLRIYFLIFPLPGLDVFISFLAAITMTLGNITALLQKNLKRLFAYSSISHIGYILVGIAVGTPYGILGALFHALNHALMKPLVFFCTGELRRGYESVSLDKLEGFGRVSHELAFATSIGLLSLAGIPGLNGFISKFILIAAAFGSGLAWLAIVAIINSAISVACYLRVLQVMFRKPKVEMTARALPSSALFPILCLTLLCIAIGLVPSPFVEWLSEAVKNSLGRAPLIISP